MYSSNALSNVTFQNLQSIAHELYKQTERTGIILLVDQH